MKIDNNMPDEFFDWFFNSLNTSRTVQIDIPNSNAGSERYSGEMILESLDIPLSADDA